jgi:molybdate transport system regulatory protein
MATSLRQRFGRPEREMRLRVICAPLGPGKVRLLEAIGETASINQAAKRMGLTYARAWGMVEELNGCFEGPLVESTTGGRNGGGTRLTPLGTEVVGLYRAIEAKAAAAAAAELAALGARVVKPAEGEEAGD